MTMMSPVRKATELLIRAKHTHPPQKTHSKQKYKKILLLIYCINVRGLTSHEQYKTKPVSDRYFRTGTKFKTKTKYRGKQETTKKDLDLSSESAKFKPWNKNRWTKTTLCEVKV